MKVESVISVIVPVYNALSTISRCVDSILAQSFANFECILVDDGSSDESGRICDEYAKLDGRIRVFHKRNGACVQRETLALIWPLQSGCSFVMQMIICPLMR